MIYSRLVINVLRVIEVGNDFFLLGSQCFLVTHQGWNVYYFKVYYPRRAPYDSMMRVCRLIRNYIFCGYPDCIFYCVTNVIEVIKNYCLVAIKRPVFKSLLHLYIMITRIFLF